MHGDSWVGGPKNVPSRGYSTEHRHCIARCTDVKWFVFDRPGDPQNVRDRKLHPVDRARYQDFIAATQSACSLPKSMSLKVQS